MPIVSSNAYGMIRAGAAKGIEDLVGELNGDVTEVFGNLGLNADYLSDAESEIPLGTYAALLEEAATTTNTIHFGLIFGSRFDPRNFGPLGYLMELSSTVADGVAGFGEYFPILQDNSRIAVEISGDEARIIYQVEDDGVADRAQDAEFSIAVLNSFCARAVGDKWKINRIEFEHNRTENVDFYKNFLGPKVMFNCATNAIICPAHLVRCAVPAHDRLMHDLILDHAKSLLLSRRGATNILLQLQDWIEGSIELGRPIDIKSAANSFGLSSRSLQRQLGKLGTNYRHVRSNSISTVATTLLSERAMSMEAISQHLGYSEVSAFSRAFKLSTGSRPGCLRGDP